MASPKQLLETTNALSADIEMSNEEVVAQIQLRALARIEKSILAKRAGEQGRIKTLDSRVETLAEATLPALRTFSSWILFSNRPNSLSLSIPESPDRLFQ